MKRFLLHAVRKINIIFQILFYYISFEEIETCINMSNTKSKILFMCKFFLENSDNT